jgi:hypothetical protein
MSTLTDEIARRRTFAIISHPDAGKTTLTEKLLLFGGAIQLAGEVKAHGKRRRVRSDWMAVERERGISVPSAVMSFEHEGLAFNLLDTPVHWDFSPLGFQRGRLLHPDRGRQYHHGVTTSINAAKRRKFASLKVSSRRSPCASIVATTLASWTWRPPEE